MLGEPTAGSTYVNRLRRHINLPLGFSAGEQISIFLSVPSYYFNDKMNEIMFSLSLELEFCITTITLPIQKPLREG